VRDAVTDGGDVHLLDLDVGIARGELRREGPHLRQGQVTAAGRHAKLHAPCVFRAGSGAPGLRSRGAPRSTSVGLSASLLSAAASGVAPRSSWKSVRVVAMSCSPSGCVALAFRVVSAGCSSLLT